MHRAGTLSLTVVGKDAYQNLCSIEPAQVQVTCQPEGMLQHMQLQQGTASHEVLLSAQAVAQGGCPVIFPSASGVYLAMCTFESRSQQFLFGTAQLKV